MLGTVFNQHDGLFNSYSEINAIDLKNRQIVNASEREVREYDMQAVRLAESGLVKEALNLLDETINKGCTLPSVYNNRAQVMRLIANVPEKSILADLDMSISLCEENGILTFPVVKRQALVQRALLRLNNGDDEKSEERALKDFEEAARLGHPQARTMVTRLNPYAKMCAAIVSLAKNQAFYSS